jgi:DNA-binding SARP family transcriptional activator
MPPLSVRLFGKFCVQRNEKAVSGLEACKLQELFSYLLIFRSSPHPRESLAALLWGDSSTTQSKKYLRQALWQLQSALVPQGKSRRRLPILSVEPDSVSVNAMAEISLDVAEFESVFSVVREIAGQDLDPSLAQTVEDTVQLYRGDLLEGWYQDWCLCERERLQSHYLSMLDKLLSYCEASHKFETGLAHGLRVLRYDRARESTHRRLMRLYYLAGDRTAALRQYEHCAAALNEELGVKPARRTVALYEQMRADQFEGLKPALTTISNSPSSADSPPVSEVMERLRQLRALLSDIHRQVQKEIKAVDLVLNSRR